MFAVDAVEEDDMFWIRVNGEFDLSRCPLFDQALAQAKASDAGCIRLSLDGLTFLDAAGLHTLLAASRRSAANGCRLRMTRGRGEVAAMFRLTALDLTIPFYD